MALKWAVLYDTSSPQKGEGDVRQTNVSNETSNLSYLVLKLDTEHRNEMWGKVDIDDLLDNNTLYLKTKSPWTTFANGGELPLPGTQTAPPNTYHVPDSLGVSLTHLFGYVVTYTRKSRKYSEHFVVWFIIYYWET